ncbi:hypothetical protein GGI13_001066 [Coemansia sp. RSA 455]|nr:hypothetical protein GGI13_001066 [Coemansia sp. RSA 455]
MYFDGYYEELDGKALIDDIIRRISTTQEGKNVESEPVSAALPTILFDYDSASVANSIAVVADTSQTSTQAVLPMDSSRQSVIRNGLLRQGFSESAITAYFDQFTDSTNYTYDFLWDAYIFDSGWGEARQQSARGNIKLVWSIVEGCPPPEKGFRVVKRSRS